MYAYKRILVGLDLSDQDIVIIKYVNYLCEVFEIDKIYFFHVAKSFELPSGLLEKYPDLIAPVDETIYRQLETSVKTHFKSNVEYSIEIKEGNTAEKILKWADFKEIDLVVMGKKENMKGEGLLPGKLVKTSHCSVLFVPESPKLSINKILIPLDFSKSGRRTLEVGVTMQKKLNCKVVFQHSFEVPWGYHTSGKTLDEFSDIMREHAQHDMEKFIDHGDIEHEDFKIKLMLDKDDDPANQITQAAKSEAVDFLIIGSRGRSELASILVGSVAEKICKHKSQIPILVVKNKQENMGFFDALLKL